MLPGNKKCDVTSNYVLYDIMADTMGYIQVQMGAASLQLTRIHARSTLCALQDYKLPSLGARN